MAVKYVYIHPGDTVEIRIVKDPEEILDKRAWTDQLARDQTPVILTIDSYDRVNLSSKPYFLSYGLNKTPI
jgi:hypothetical protein